jgi:hypothetical protein
VGRGGWVGEIRGWDRGFGAIRTIIWAKIQFLVDFLCQLKRNFQFMRSDSECEF